MGRDCLTTLPSPYITTSSDRLLCQSYHCLWMFSDRTTAEDDTTTLCLIMALSGSRAKDASQTRNSNILTVQESEMCLEQC